EAELKIVVTVVGRSGRVVRIILEVNLERVAVPDAPARHIVDEGGQVGHVGRDVDAQAAVLDFETPADRGWTSPKRPVADRDVLPTVQIDLGRVLEGGRVDAVGQRDRVRGQHDGE